MLLTIDRFEGDFAVVETGLGDRLSIPRALLPHDAAEGQTFRITRDLIAESEGAARIRSLMDELFD